MAEETPIPNSGQPEKDASAYLAPGFLVGGGRFNLLRELGHGGMGVVWLAQDERLMMPVALKFLPEKVSANPAALNDLRQETKKSRMLSHPNIIRIYDLYEAPDEVAFISMEYVEGPSLWALRSQQPNGFFAWEFLKPIATTLCEALAYAHGEGVIHRDLKPANMLLDDRQRLRLADFGIAARDIGFSATSPAQLRTTGTPAYMSPQQIEGKPAHVTDDVYALGATLYEFLSGRPPFYQNDIVYQVRNVLPTPLSDRLADLEVENPVPPDVAALIMACLSKDPSKRPQSARAVTEWIGLAETTGTLRGGFVPTVFVPSRTKEPAIETKTAETEVPPPIAENTVSIPLAAIAGAAALALVTWLGWGYLMPKSATQPAPASPPVTNSVSSPGTNASNAAPALVSNIAPAVITGGTSVGIELGAVNEEGGLHQVSGPDFGVTAAATVGGRECRRFESRRNARCYFQIAPEFKRPGPMNARIQVEYLAAAAGVMQIKFDGSSRQTPHYSNGGKINFEADAAWKTANYQVNDALFRKGEMGGADFCLTASCPELYVHSVTVFFDQ